MASEESVNGLYVEVQVSPPLCEYGSLARLSYQCDDWSAYQVTPCGGESPRNLSIGSDQLLRRIRVCHHHLMDALDSCEEINFILSKLGVEITRRAL